MTFHHLAKPAAVWEITVSKGKRKRFIAFKCNKCGHKIIMLPYKSWEVPVNFRSLSFNDKDTISAGYKIIFRPNIHKSHKCKIGKEKTDVNAGKV